MPTASNGSVSLHYSRDGDAAADTAPVVFISDAGLGGWLWGWQHAALTGPFETIVWDLRGTGRSDAPSGPYDLSDFVADLEAVLTDCDARSAHLVGCGLGGAIALAAARSTTRVETLSLFGTAAIGDAFSLESLFAPPDDRDAIRESLESVLSADFVASQPKAVEGMIDWRADGDADRAGWEAQVAALDDFDATDWLVEVTQPTRVFHGTEDSLVDPDVGRALARGLPRGEFGVLESVGHLGFIERSRDVNDRLLGFLESESESKS